MNAKFRIGSWMVCATIAFAGVARASFPSNQTVAGGDRDSVFRVTNGNGGSGTLNMFGAITSTADNARMCFVTANHVVAGSTVANVDYRGVGHAGTFNEVPFNQSRQQVGGEDLVFIGLHFRRTDTGNADFTTLTGIAPLTLAADAGGNYSFQEWGYGVTASPDVINATAYPFVYHTANAGEQYGTLRTFTNQITVNNLRAAAAGGLTIRDLDWNVRGPLVLLQMGSGTPGDSGAGLSNLSGPGTTISGILTGGTDTRFDAAGNVVMPNTTENRIAWRSALGNTDVGFGLGFTDNVVTDLNNKCTAWRAAIPEPGTLSLLLVGVLMVRRQRATRGLVSAN